MSKKKIEIDIGGQIQQLNYDSALGFRRDNGLEKSVFLRSQDKKDIIKKYEGQVINLIEKLHCILIYYCIKDSLDDINKIKICSDIKFRVLKNLPPFLFKENNYLNEIKIIPRRGNERISSAHSIALRSHRKRRFADNIINKEMIEDVLFNFKK